MPPPIVVRPLESADAPAFVALRRLALDDAPRAFAASPADDRVRDVDVVAARLSERSEGASFGAFMGDDAEAHRVDPLAGLRGIVEIHPDRFLKMAHKAHVFGMFVHPTARDRGVGRLLVERTIAHARTMAGVSQIHLSVSETASAARRLYERCGFRVWGTEPRALAHDSDLFAEHHMILVLDEDDREGAARGAVLDDQLDS